ncbi:hypothetical protein V8E36_002423 [Tilletia maclaganii]
MAAVGSTSAGGVTPGLPSQHPSHPALAHALQSSPSHAPALFQSFNDLAHSARWTHLEPVNLELGHQAGGEQPAQGDPPAWNRRRIPGLVGWKKDEKQATLVVTLHAFDRISPSFLADIFAALHALPNPYPFHTRPHGPTLVLVADNASDASDAARPPAPQPEVGVHARVPLGTDALTLAILGQDGTVVYYHMAEGIRKPIN